MPLEVAAPLTLILIGIVVIVHTHWLRPRRARRALAASLAAQSWTPVEPGQEPLWPDVAKLAIEEDQGAFRGREYDETAGPVTFHVKRTEERSGRTVDLYREDGAPHPRYAAVGFREERTSSRSFAGGNRSHTSYGHEIWIGEARPMPVERPEMLFSGFSQMLGERAREMARARGLDPESMQDTASPPSEALARTLRELLLRDDRARKLMAKVIVGPRAWVVVAPVPRVGRRLDAFLDLARQVSDAIERQAGRRG